MINAIEGALEIVENSFIGKQSLEYASLCVRLASAYEQWIYSDKALSYCDVALRIQSQILGKNCEKYAQTLTLRASILKGKGALSEALSNCLESLTIRENLEDSDEASLDEILMMENNENEKEGKTIEKKEKSLNRNLAHSLNVWASILEVQGKWDLAFEKGMEAKRILEQTIGKKKEMKINKK